MEIPNYVKINGRLIKVIESPRGYVTVGNTTEYMNANKKINLNALEGDEHINEWEKAMYKLFEKALEKERKNRKLT